MKKIVEIEYVGIEDLQEIMDDAYALIKEGHYVRVSLGNISEMALVNVGIKMGGYEEGKQRDYDFDFYMSEDKDDVDIMNKCKATLKNLLSEE